MPGFLNQEWVQQALGVPVNWTSGSMVASVAFGLTGDTGRVPGVQAMEDLLASGVTLAVVNGDRDPDVPWTSTEQISLDVNWNGAEHFRNAGYESVQVNESYNGGFVRQHGNLSFTRVFQSGHDGKDLRLRN